MSDFPSAEQQARDLLQDAIDSWPNKPWLVLPGPVDISPGLATHLSAALAPYFAEVSRLRAQETRIRALAKSGGVYEPGPDRVSKRAILASLDTEGEA